MIGAKEPRRSLLPAGWEYAYAYVFFIAVFLGQTVRFFVGSEPLIGAQPAQILIPLIAVLISAALWLVSPAPIRKPSGLAGLFFWSLMLLWFWALVRDWGAVDLTAFALGPFIFMLATKLPTPTSARRILNTLGVLALLLFALAALYAAITEVSPTGFTTKWPPFTDPFDPIGMWWAPFNGPAEAGSIGALLIILGVGQKNALSAPFIVGGGLMLFYAGTLGAALGLGAAMLVLLLGFARTSPHGRWLRIGSASLMLFAGAVLLQELWRNPTLSSRTAIWSDFLQLVQVNPIWGWGSAALIRSEETGIFPWGEARLAHGSDAHNLILDVLVRYGVLGLGTLSLILVVVVAIAFRGWRLGQGIGAAVIAMTFVMGLAELQIWWGAPGTGYAVLLLGVMCCFPSEIKSRSNRRHEHSAYAC